MCFADAVPRSHARPATVIFVGNLDSYVLANTPEWERLEELVAKAGQRGSRLEGAELDELLHRYQRTSTHLSHVRSTYGDPAVTARLTRTVASARAVIYGAQPQAAGAIRNFFLNTFPAAVWNARVAIFIAMLAFVLPAIASGIWIANSPATIDALAPPALREAFIEEDFEAYYSSSPAAEFSTMVFINNIQVSFLAFVAGIAGAVPTLLLLAFNGGRVGEAAGLFHDAGEAARFWGLILPHGLLEISAIIVAGGAGLRLGWALISPGDRPRTVALAEEAQRAASIVIGLVLVFVIAGLIEGFVTPSPLPTWARVAIGTAAFAAFWAYVIGLGPAAAAQGHTGSIRDAVRVKETPEPVASAG